MAVKSGITDFADQLTAWRRDIHAHPETAFEEFRTADVVAGKLEEFGIEPNYDFNDDALVFGASYWATLVEQQLAMQA